MAPFIVGVMTMLSTLTPLCLKPKADRRLRAGHPWIYSNEIDVEKTPLKQYQPGQQVLLENAQGKPMGIAYVNPNSLICARLISRDIKYPLDKSLLVHRLNIALALREQFSASRCYRLVYGDSDWLSGLVVDRFDDIVAVQIATAGMEAVKDQIRNRVVGFGWKDLHHPWSKDGYEYTAEELFEHLLTKIVPNLSYH